MLNKILIGGVLASAAACNPLDIDRRNTEARPLDDAIEEALPADKDLAETTGNVRNQLYLTLSTEDGVDLLGFEADFDPKNLGADGVLIVRATVVDAVTGVQMESTLELDNTHYYVDGTIRGEIPLKDLNGAGTIVTSIVLNNTKAVGTKTIPFDTSPLPVAPDNLQD